jgi:hypothetical protein
MEPFKVTITGEVSCVPVDGESKPPSGVSAPDAKELRERDFEREKLRVEIWQKTIETQMHFNEMSVKSRQLGLTFVVAALGLALVLLTRSDPIGILNLPAFGKVYSVHVSSVIVLLSACAIIGVRQLDLNVYHKMLRGSVAFGEELEYELRNSNTLPTEKGLTEAVSYFSRNANARFDVTKKFGGIQEQASRYGTYTDFEMLQAEQRQSIFYWKIGENAYDKVRFFYRMITWFLLIVGFLLLAVSFKAGEPEAKATIAHQQVDKVDAA